MIRGNSTPLANFGIDRLELGRLGIGEDVIDSIYRSLYVNSVGFYTKLEEYAKHIKEDKMLLKIRIWNVFNVLLQYACETEFKMITTRIIEDY